VSALEILAATERRLMNASKTIEELRAELTAAQTERDEARAGYDRLMEALNAQTVLGARMAGVVDAARAYRAARATRNGIIPALDRLDAALRRLDAEAR
jgi:hypothetical protein